MSTKVKKTISSVVLDEEQEPVSSTAITPMKGDEQQKEVNINELCDGFEKFGIDTKLKEKSFIDSFKKEGKKWVEENVLNSTMTMTQPGSLKFGLWGSTPSIHSISIKFGMFGEFMFKKVIENTEEMELLKCGIQPVNEKGKKKDLDMIWVDKQKKTLRYRELKGNIEMDSEKIPATIDDPTILEEIKADKSYFWPKINSKYLQSKKCNIVVQINGKKRSLISTDNNIEESDLIEKIKGTKELQKFIEKKIIIKTIFIKDKLINLIIK